MMVVLVMLVTLAGWRLVDVQIVGADRYVEWGADQRVQRIEIAGARGSILDRDRNALVLSDDRPTIWVDPTFVTDVEASAVALHDILGLEVEVIRAALSSDRQHEFLLRQVDTGIGDAVRALGLDGVFVTEEPARLRPNGPDFARGLLGRVDVDQSATSGIELYYDDLLAGVGGWQIYEQGRDGTLVPAGSSSGEAATPGEDIVLTIHRETQFLAEQILIEQVEATSAKGGYAVIMRTGTGEVLAAASVSLDRDTGVARPSSYNGAYLDTYEPGSVNKVFTIAAAIEAGVVETDTEFEVPETYEFADKIFSEPFSTGVGELTVSQIVSKSSNIGTIRVAELVGKDRLYEFLVSVGMGSRTGKDGSATVPDESAGILVPSSGWFGTELAAISFGQGLALTPIQVAGAYNAIANDGLYVRPTLVRGFVDREGMMHRWPIDPGTRAMSSETVASVTAMMTEVVAAGTGRLAAVDGYTVAGKTGTAQKPFEGGYSDTDYMSTFAGFVPAADPELTIVVVLDTAATYLAGEVAAPLFSELAEYVLRTLRVPPTDSALAASSVAEAPLEATDAVD